MQQIGNVPTGEEMGREASRSGIEPNRQELLVRNDPEETLTELPIAAPTADLRATTVSGVTRPQEIVANGQAARATSAPPDIQQIAAPQTSAAGFLPGPAEAQAMTGSNDGLSADWSAVFVLAVVAALLVLTRLIGRSSVPPLPDKPLAKLLHTRPWR